MTATSGGIASGPPAVFAQLAFAAIAAAMASMSPMAHATQTLPRRSAGCSRSARTAVCRASARIVIVDGAQPALDALGACGARELDVVGELQPRLESVLACDDGVRIVELELARGERREIGAARGGEGVDEALQGGGIAGACVAEEGLRLLLQVGEVGRRGELLAA